ncbi:MAG: hypothetical protein U1F68_18470 [Gammaproteobacteria bacterium]
MPRAGLGDVSAWIFALRRPVQRLHQRGETAFMIRIAVLAFAGIAACRLSDCSALTGALISNCRPASLKPF